MCYAAFAVLAVLSLGIAVGCEDEIATEREVDVKGDRVETTETTVSEMPGGGIETTEERTVEPIGD